MKWRSARDVYALSTKHKATTSSVPVKSKAGPMQILKPDLILDYNLYKTGVDRNDQLHSYYPFQRKTMKWWKKLFFHVFVMALVNGYILYKEVTGKRKPLADYMKEVALKMAIVGGEIQNERPGPSTSSVNRTFARHFPKKVPPTEKKVNATRYCKVCSDRGKKESGKRIRKESRWWCEECGVGLCVPECFERFHTRVTYA